MESPRQCCVLFVPEGHESANGLPIFGLHLEHGGFVAPGQAHDGFDLNEAIFGHLAHLDADVLAQVLEEIFGAAQGAGQVSANLNAVFPARFFL